ncbi:MAG TPA: hypothetical protein PKY59_23380 [Pyrinomonadaceae bacterium]|nr:hypothetical protein [Pyrinomonadaceae bacterium]
MATEAKQSMENEPQTGGQNSGNQIDAQSIKETGGAILETVKDKASTVIDEHKTNLTSGLSSVADSIRKVGDNLRDAEDENKIGQMTAQYSDQLAKGIEKVTTYFDKNDLRGIARDVETFASRQPALFIGGAFVLGILAARFLKSSAPNGNGSTRRNRSQNSDAFYDSEGVHPV